MEAPTERLNVVTGCVLAHVLEVPWPSTEILFETLEVLVRLVSAQAARIHVSTVHVFSLCASH